MTNALTRWCYTNPWLAILLLLTFGLTFAGGVTRVQIDGSLESLVAAESDSYAYHLDVKENFRSDGIVVVFASGRSLFSPGSISYLSDLEQRLRSISGIERTESIFTIPLNGNATGSRPAAFQSSWTGETVDQLRKLALQDPLARNILINQAGEAIAILAFLSREDDGQNNRSETVRKIRNEIFSTLPDPPLSVSLKILGGPALNEVVQEKVLVDILVLTPLAGLVIFITGFVFFRKFSTAILPLVCSSVATLITVGFIGYLGIGITVYLSIILLLILVISCTESFHILSDFESSSTERLRSFEMGSGNAIFLTTLSSTAGFLIVAFTPIAGLRDFGLVGAFGMVTNYFVTIAILTTSLSLGKRASAEFGFFSPGALLKLEKTVAGNKRSVPVIFTLLLCILALGVSRLSENTPFLSFLPPSDEFVLGTNEFAEQFEGSGFLSVTYETEKKGGVFTDEARQEIRGLHNFLTSHHGTAYGLVNLEEAVQNHQTNGSATAPPGQLPHSLTSRFVDHDQSRTLIRLLAPALDSRSVLRIKEAIADYAEENFRNPDAVRVTGNRVLISEISQDLTGWMARNLGILILFFGVLIAIRFRSIRLGLVSVVLNIFPVFVLLGVMGWFKIELSIGLFPAAILVLGIAIDDTIHLLSRFAGAQERGMPMRRSLRHMWLREFKPILITTIVVVAGFSITLLSGFQVTRELGLLLALSMIGAFLADLLLAPFLLSRLDLQ